MPLIVALQLGAAHYLDPRLSEPFWVAILLGAFAILLTVPESMGRKTKSMFDWTIAEAIIMGFAQLLALIPGAGRMLGILAMSQFRNFNREAVLKYSLLAGLPILTYSVTGLLREHGTGGSDWVSILNFGATLGVSLGVSLLTLAGFQRSFLRTGIRGQLLYRVIAGGALAIWIWSRGIH
jgi:undecaprenyl-diphosphatase